MRIGIGEAFALTLVVSSLLGCAQSAGGVKFAVAETSAASETVVRPKAFRVVATRIDLRQPIFLHDAGDAVEVTYARKQREGVTVRLDARTLEPIGEPASYLYPRCSARDVSARLSRDVSRVTLEGGRQVLVFTSDEHNRAFARVGDGPAEAMSPEGLSVIGPARATTSGNAIVGVFIAATPEGFELIATSMSLVDVQRSPVEVKRLERLPADDETEQRKEDGDLGAVDGAHDVTRAQ